MIAPLKEITLKDFDGNDRKFILSRVPATHMREIVARYGINALPKVGDYDINADMMLKLMSYVGVPQKEGGPLMLTTRELIDNHTNDMETLAKLEMAMFQHNTSFFLPESLSNLSERFRMMATTFLTQIVTQCLRESSRNAEPPSTN